MNKSKKNSIESIVIVTYKVDEAPPWDPDSIKSGVTGSEEAVIYMSQELAQLGYQVTVLANPPRDSPHSTPQSNPRFVDVSYSDDTIYDIAIAWRLPWAAEAIRKYARKVFLWPHDVFFHRLTAEQIDGFDDVLWLSKWQRDYWISQNPEFARYKSIFGNGINPEQFQPVQARKNPYACIYGSNYSRGLEILLDFWPKIKLQYPKATLDIYYGWQHWGLLSEEKEAKLRKQLANLALLGVAEHGLVGHEELNRAYERSSFWTYPCTRAEVFCISALRAQLAGAIPIIIEGSALPETVRYGYKCKHASQYYETLCLAFDKAEDITLEERESMGSFIVNEFTWKSIAEKWKILFNHYLSHFG